ncbi:hypothetical protein KL86SPO_50180 [uncultured Sporomusa sp.]|uniref:Transglycosylase SLT domain-containing protein n=1 Tax=uncultured Sporomusa sp. TaxID=307249 RepID=A0A212LYD2_9FIRM|nr:LPD38 domain-containing protein [uncultured Sporomusa sp.]SCM82409.1 hypothetical protein KL86SPO_50180 [uncultured Sporomusa sp.]
MTYPNPNELLASVRGQVNTQYPDPGQLLNSIRNPGGEQTQQPPQHIPAPEIPIDVPQDEPVPGFVTNVAKDVSGIMGNYVTGAAQAYQERIRSSDAAGQAFVNTLTRQGTMDDYGAAVEREGRANRQFIRDVAGTPAIVGAIAGVPGAGIIAGPIVARDIYDAATARYQDDGMFGAAKQAAGDITGIGPLVEEAPKLITPDYWQQAYEQPITTIGNTAMAFAPAALIGKGAYKSAKHMVNEKVNKALDEFDFTQSDTAPARPGVNSLVNAIAEQESGGKYDVRNSDSGAAGKFQIMPENWPEWAAEFGLERDAPMTPHNQDFVASRKIQKLYQKYGNPEDVARAWYAGEGYVDALRSGKAPYSPDARFNAEGYVDANGKYPSVNEYAAQVNGRMRDTGFAPDAVMDYELSESGFRTASREELQTSLLDTLKRAQEEKWDASELNAKEQAFWRDIPNPEKKSLGGEGVLFGEQQSREPSKIILPGEGMANPEAIKIVNALKEQARIDAEVARAKGDPYQMFMDARNAGDYYRAARWAEILGSKDWAEQYRKLWWKEQGFKDDPSVDINRVQSTLADMRPEINQFMADTTNQIAVDRTNARQGFVNALEAGKQRAFDNAEAQSATMRMNPEGLVMTEFFNQHGIAPAVMEKSLRRRQEKLINEQVNMLRGQMRQGTVKAVMENSSGDKFSRNLSMNHQWYRDMIDANGGRMPNKANLDYWLRETAIDQLRKGYTDPVYGEIARPSAEFVQIEKALSGLSKYRKQLPFELRGWEKNRELSEKAMYDGAEVGRMLDAAPAPAGIEYMRQGKRDYMKAEAPHMPIVDEGFKEKPAYKYAKMDPISESDAMAYHQATGLDLNGYRHEITSHEVKHALKQHGGDSERLRGQIPITREDFSLLPEITKPENIVGVEKGKRKQDIILYEKRVNGHILAVEEVLVGRQTLRFLSMRKRPSAQLNVGRNTDPVSHVQDGRSLASSDSSVPNLPPSVNGKGKEYMAATSGMTVPSNSPRPVNPGGEAVTGTVTRKQIVDKVNDFFTKVSTGRLGVRGVLGWFDRNSEVIRTKDYADFRTIMHEIGHYLDKGLGLRSERSFDSELLSAVQRRFGDAYNDLPLIGRRGEGIAEFFHDYTTNPSRAKQEFPQYYAAFEQRLAQEPAIKAKVNEVQQMLHTWYNQSSEARVKGSISFADGRSTVHKAIDAARNPVETTQTVIDKGRQGFEAVYDHMVDQLAPLDRMMREIEQITGEKIPMVKDVFKRAWLSRGWAGKAQTLIERGLPEKGIPSLKSIVHQVGVNRHKDFSGYVAAMRELDAYRIEMTTDTKFAGHTFSKIDAARSVANWRNVNPDFVDLHKQLITYQNYLLDILVESGLKDRQTVEIWKAKWPNYAPFFRDFSSEAAVEKFLSTKGLGNLPDPVKKFKGDQRDPIDPLESIVKNTYQFFNLAERNNVGRLFIELAQKPGVGKVIEGDLAGHASTKDSTFSVWDRGQKRVFQTTPELYRAVMMLDKPAAEGIVKILQIPAGWLRAGAVLSPEFIMRNPVRDSWTAFINTKYGFIPGIDTMRGLAHFMKKDDLYWEYMNSGAAHATMVSLDRDYLARNIRQFMKTSAVDKAITVINPRTYLEVLRSFSEATEMATRLAEYENAKRGYSGVLNRLFSDKRTFRTNEEAALGARDVTLDFSRSGSNEYGKFMNKTVAFWNATVQGTDKMIRSFKDNPVGFSSRVFMSITLPSIVLYYMNRDDPRYQELPQWQKDLFWIIPTQDTLIRIPKPFEMGILFGTSAERMLQWMDSKDKSQAAAKKQIKSFSGTVGEALMPSWIPTAALPVIEWLTNYSLFMDRNLVSPSQAKLPNKLQYGPNASAIGKYVGEKLDVSPAKVDNSIRGYTGGLGGLAMFAGDAIAGEFNKRPAMRVSEMPGVRAFTATPYKSSQSVQEFYDEYTDQEKLYNEWKQTGNKPEGYDAARYQRLKAVDKIIDEIHKAQKQVMADTKISSEAKRQRLDKLQLQAVDVARAGLWKPKIATK